MYGTLDAYNSVASNGRSHIMCISGMNIIGYKNRMDSKRIRFLRSHRIVSCETTLDEDETIAFVGQPSITGTGFYAVPRRKSVYWYMQQACAVLLLGIAITPLSMAESAFDPAKNAQNSDAKSARKQQYQSEREGNARLSENYEGMHSEHCSTARMSTMKSEQKAACEQIRKMGEVLRMHSR
jgi:hypothetical protein